MRTFGYKHWTLEETPRCFYVGKGAHGRASSTRSRNHKWHAIVKRLGLRIDVCVGPLHDVDAIVWEIAQISTMGTFSTCHDHDNLQDVGCNFTKGGEGTKGTPPNKVPLIDEQMNLVQREPTTYQAKIEALAKYCVVNGQLYRVVLDGDLKGYAKKATAYHEAQKQDSRPVQR